MSSLSAQVIHWGSPRPEGAPLYYHGDHLGSARLLSGYSGYPISSSIFLPYGEEFNPQVTIHHYKFTGKERDSESGLDNFGARYDSSQYGRFMTPDPLLNSGRPWEPQSWNRYAYVMNNPLRYTDPDGLYDFDTQCGDDKKCLDNQERFTAAVERLRAIASSLPKNSEQKKAIDKALGAIGTAGDGNGVTVKFGETATGGPMETFGKTITVDWQTLDSRSADFRQMGIAVDVGVEAAAGIAHEGIHLTQDSSLLNRRMFQNAFDILNYYERVAYEAQSFVNEASRSFSTGGVWNTVWADGPDKELLRQRAIREAARESTEASREDYNRRNPR
jgi:RHS repeat-associated protein